METARIYLSGRVIDEPELPDDIVCVEIPAEYIDIRAIGPLRRELAEAGLASHEIGHIVDTIHHHLQVRAVSANMRRARASLWPR